MAPLRSLFLCARFALCAALPWLAAGAQAQAVNPVVDWNRTLLSIVRTPNMQPATMHSTRSFAMMHLAIEGAVEQFHGDSKSVESLRQVAAIAAAYRTLVSLYPAAQTSLDQSYQSSLAAVTPVPQNDDLLNAVLAGRRAAERILRNRANDGSNGTPPPYTFGTNAGDYQSTPPNFPKQSQLVGWGQVTPFSLRNAAQFRPGPPPSLNSGVYSRSLNEVQTLGALANSSATAEQMLIGKFWNGSIQNYWNEIAQTASVAEKLNTAETARVFALLNAALADSAIAFYEAKYQYNFWRPVTAIRGADPSATPGAVADAQWLPEVTNTAPDPSYPGAHAVISAAVAEVLIATLKTEWLSFEVSSEVMSGVTRHFDSIAEAEAEASRSRVYAGAHFTFDLVTGARLGRQVADYVLEHGARLD